MNRFSAKSIYGSVAIVLLVSSTLLYTRNSYGEEEWIYIASDKNTKFFVKPSSVRREKEYLKAEVKLEYLSEIERELKNKDGETKKIRIKEHIGRLNVLCDSRMWSESAYTRRDSSGEVVNSSSRPQTEWEKTMREAAPGTALARTIDVLCESRSRGGQTDGGITSPKTNAGVDTPAKPRSFGTGIAISSSGDVVTNHHVINGCSRISIYGRDRIEHSARKLGTDSKNDIAVIKADTRFEKFASFRSGSQIKSGENLVVAGYPLTGILATEPNIAFGYVSATAGIGDDSTTFQISAPIHKGNSGGPILDQSGRVIGVVSSKLNAAKTAAITGDLPQNIGFGVKGEVVQIFLNSQGIAPSVQGGKRTLENVDLAAVASGVVLQVLCY